MVVPVVMAVMRALYRLRVFKQGMHGFCDRLLRPCFLNGRIDSLSAKELQAGGILYDRIYIKA